MAIELELIIEIIMTKELKATLFEGASDIFCSKLRKNYVLVTRRKYFFKNSIIIHKENRKGNNCLMSVFISELYA